MKHRVAKSSEQIIWSEIQESNVWEREIHWKLISIAHLYHVEDLILDCTQYLKLKVNITDENVMGSWMEAVNCANDSLCQTALDHFVEMPKGKVLWNVPGFTEVFASHDKPLKDFLEKFSTMNYQLKESNLICVGNLGITVQNITTFWSGVFLVKRTDTISKLLDMICLKRVTVKWLKIHSKKLNDNKKLGKWKKTRDLVMILACVLGMKTLPSI